MTDADKQQFFQTIFSENRDKIYRLCFGYLHNKTDVDDLFQEVMLNVWKSLPGLRGDSHANTWIYRIAVNTALLYNKRHARLRQRIHPTDFAELDQVGKNEPVFDPRLEQLHYCIAQLKKQDKIIITLFLEGFCYEEIAEITGISVSYVGVKINRIKTQLSLCMKKEAHE